MGATKKPRKAYRPRDVLMTPLPYASTAYMVRTISLRVRSGIQAILDHTATESQVRELHTEVVSLAALVDVAKAQPDACPLTGESLDAVGEELQRIAHSVASITRRMEDTGRIGCSGQERADLAQLADLHEQLLTTMPRKLWHAAYDLALKRPTLTVEEVIA